MVTGSQPSTKRQARNPSARQPLCARLKTDYKPDTKVQHMLDFAGALHEFDTVYAGSKKMSRSLCTVDGKFIDEINLIGKDKKRLEEYYKWQFIYALMKGRGYPQDYIGAEINLPKGNIGSTPIKIDACVFSDVK